MKIIKGPIASAQRHIIYGTEGIGKTTFASRYPDPLFIDTEGSTKNYNVTRMEAPQSWAMLLEEVKYVIDNPSCCMTLVIDTLDWAEKLCILHTCEEYKKKKIEDFGYGIGYRHVYDNFGKLLNLLDEVINIGINVVLTAHARINKFEQPDEMGSYDRYELKLINTNKCSISAMVKEWADAVFFANYSTFVVKVDDKSNKAKATGGKRRVMYTEHTATWDAKNRYGLPDKVDFDFSAIAQFVPSSGSYNAPKDEPVVTRTSSKEDTINALKDKIDDFIDNDDTPPWGEPTAEPKDLGIPDALLQLMSKNNIDESEIREVVAKRGYYPESTPIKNYDIEFVNGVLIGAWSQIEPMILESRKF